MLKQRTGISMPLCKRTKHIVLMFALILISVVTNSQQLNNKIKVNYKNTSLKEVCTDLEQKSSFRFSYSEKNLKSYDKTVTLKSDDLSMLEILDNVFDNTPLQYTVKGNVIVVSANPLYDKNGTNRTPGVLNGKVNDQSTGELLSGVTIKIGSINLVTNNEGYFETKLPQGKYSIAVSSVGYTDTIIDGIDIKKNKPFETYISLSRGNSSLNEVVVTALGIKREKKKLGYAVQEIKGDDLNVAKGTNMLAGLQGKVAGLNMTQASTGIANSVRIVLRGESSLNINKNQALIVVDGMPINNNSGTPGPTIYQLIMAVEEQK